MHRVRCWLMRSHPLAGYDQASSLSVWLVLVF